MSANAGTGTPAYREPSFVNLDRARSATMNEKHLEE